MKERVHNGPPKLDELDLMLVQELEKDARISFLALASRLGTSQPTVQRRFKRLIDLGIITIAAIPTYAALGHRMALLMVFNAPPGKINKLTKQLAAINNIRYIWVTAGHYNILAVAFYQNTEDYLTAFQKEFHNIQRDARLETLLPIKMIKSDMSDLTNEADLAPNPGVVITELDISVMKELEKSPRIPVKELAKVIGVTLSPVRSSLHKLTSKGIIRVIATHDPAAFGYNVVAIVLIQVHPSGLKALTDKLKVYPYVKAITLTIGAFNCVIWATFQSSDEMSNFLTHDLGNMPGLMHYESLLMLRIEKLPFNLVGYKP
ncbi:Lrp/AsnC family transcriptional regulator [Chloroflexota bacterium]